MPKAQLSDIVNTYRRVSSAAAIPDRLLAQVKLLRDQAEEDRSGNFRAMFQPRGQLKTGAQDPAAPRDSFDSIFSYWLVEPACAQRDLDDFVALSVGEDEIADSHPELTPHERRKLYMRWLGLSPNSFMALRKYDEKRSIAPVVAVSIILPLTTAGAARIWNREADAVALRDEDIGVVPGHQIHLMLDTLIVKPERRGSGIDLELRRADHKGYGLAMIPVHAGLFWDAEQDAVLMVEPDNPKVSRVCAAMGFAFTRRASDLDDKGCYKLEIFRDGPKPFESQRIASNYVRDMSRHPIKNLARSPLPAPRTP